MFMSGKYNQIIQQLDELQLQHPYYYTGTWKIISVCWLMFLLEFA